MTLQSYLRRGRSIWFPLKRALLRVCLILMLTLSWEVDLGAAVAEGSKGNFPPAVVEGSKDRTATKPGASAIVATNPSAAAEKPSSLPGAGFTVLSFGDAILRLFGIAAVIAAATGRLIVWGGGKAYEEFSANLKQRRTFVQETTKRVVDLAWTHYWGLATAAGSLAGPLRDYLRAIEAHLLVNYETPKDMQKRFDELARETADRSFPALVRLIVQFHRFQFVGSNTYLLPNHESGESLRRLYNRFVTSLPDERAVATIRVQIDKYLSGTTAPDSSRSTGLASDNELAASKSPASKTSLLADLLDGAILEDLDRRKELGLEEVAENWKGWLSTNLVQVEAATEALEAFDALIAHELAELHSFFFRDRSFKWDGSVGIPAALAWADKRWPAIVDERHLATIARAKFLPRSFLPLGGVAMSARRDEAPQPKRASAAPKDGREDGPPSLPPLPSPPAG